MTKKIEYSILAAFVALMYAVAKVIFPDFPLTEQIIIGLFLYVLAQLGVEVIGKPAVRALFPNRFKGIHEHTE